MTDRQKHLYEHLTWPEVNDPAVLKRVVVIPVGNIEDHGYHLPLDTDNLSVNRICLEAGRRAVDEIVVMPLVPYGYDPHHMDFPGTISIQAEHFAGYVYDIARSVASHGFDRIVLVNGHGSNGHLLDAAARHVVLHTQAMCATAGYWELIRETAMDLRDSEFPGGMSHACELETSLYLHLEQNRVDMAKAIREISFPKSRFVWHDLIKGSPVHLVRWWSQVTKSGVVGDPTLATAEKGRRIFDAAVEALIAFAREFRALLVPPRTDHHERIQV